MISSCIRRQSFVSIGSDKLDEIEKDTENLTEYEQKKKRDIKCSTIDFTTYIHSSCSTRDTVTYLRQSGLKPRNHMVNAHKVMITGIQVAQSGRITPIDPPLHCSLYQGIKLAKDAGLDLVNKSTQSASISNSNLTHICEIRDGVSDTLVEVNQKYKCDVPKKSQKINPHVCSIRGATGDFDMNHKSIRAAKYLYKKCPVLLTLSDFGSAAEGMPVLQHMLSFIKRACERLKVAGHHCGPIYSSYDEIWVFLYPPTKRAESASYMIQHPSQSDLDASMKSRTTAEYEEIHDRLKDEKLLGAKRIQYENSIENGTAWAFADKGLRGSTLRYWKIKNGWLPKGKKHFALRSDIELSNFRTKSASTVDKVLHLPEKNTDQAERGIGVLTKRGKMRVSDLYDEGEHPDSESVLHRFHYKLGGADAYTLRKVKEDTGLQRFWNTKDKKPPKFASNFADGFSGKNIERMHFQSSRDTYS